MDLNGYSHTARRNVLLNADVDLNGGSFLVSGNLHQVDGALHINKGLLKVEGSYGIESTEADEEGIPKPSYGWIDMEDESDRVEILADFWARSYNSSILKAGRMQFSGNVTDYRGITLDAGGTHEAYFANAGEGMWWI